MEPGGWETHWALGKSYYYRQQYDQALRASQQALSESNGRAPQIELLVAQSLTAVGRYEDRSEERRVGKECRTERVQDNETKESNGGRYKETQQNHAGCTTELPTELNVD